MIYYISSSPLKEICRNEIKEWQTGVDKEYGIWYYNSRYVEKRIALWKLNKTTWMKQMSEVRSQRLDCI